MATITAHARKAGIPVVGWDLAHAAGNVELRLHDWDVDFAVWCTYKYLNAGPGCIAGAFVHEKHGRVEYSTNKDEQPAFYPRLSGWYGNDKSTRFLMDKTFRPTPGAAGWQVSNPSAIDLASLAGALDVWGMTTISELRSKALVLTAYAECLLDTLVAEEEAAGRTTPFDIITPRNPLERGTQVSVLLKREGLLDRVSEAFVEKGIVCDKRKPDVIRVAPVPLYCTFADVWRFVGILGQVLKEMK
jgi:kynureninase